MIVYFVLCLGLLAGWGLDELSARRDALPRERDSCWRWRRRSSSCRSCGWSARGHADRRPGCGRRSRWPGASPTRPCPPRRGEPGGGRRADERAAAVAAAGGPGAGADRAAPARSRLAAPVRDRFVARALVLLAVDLFRANMGYNPAITKEDAVMPETGAIRYLQSRTPNRFAGLGLSPFEPLPADHGHELRPLRRARLRLPDRGALRQAVAALGQRPARRSPSPPSAPTPRRRSIRALSLLSVTDLLVSPGDAPAAPARAAAWPTAAPTRCVYRNANALPRVFLVGRQRTVGGEREALAAATAPGFDGRRVAVTERELPGLPQDDGRGAPWPAPARLVSYEPERVVARASATRAQPAGADRRALPGLEGHGGRPRRADRAGELPAARRAVPAGTHGWSSATSRPASAPAGSSA